jgi:hypothetical protein
LYYHNHSLFVTQGTGQICKSVALFGAIHEKLKNKYVYFALSALAALFTSFVPTHKMAA